LLDEELQYLIYNIAGAMAGDFYRVLAGVAVGSAEDGKENLVEEGTMLGERVARSIVEGGGGVETREVDGVGCGGGAVKRTEGGDDGEGMRTTDPDDA
jgi:hypothetical protein